jgi:hypothetical protein
MIELSMQQSAELLVVRHAREDLEGHGGAAALLRF